MRVMPRQLRPAWVPFVWAALAFTVLVGALNGALNLWSIQVLGRPVPVEHHQSHALAQLFGFVWLLTAGVSLHLAPRLLGGRLPTDQLVRLIRLSGIGGVTALCLGRLGRLLPGSAAIGALGAFLVVLAMGAWLAFIVTLFRERQVVGDLLPAFVLAGTSWWTFASLLLLGWQLGQSLDGTPLGGVFQRVPFSAVTAAALFGGSSSWVFGISLRAGACTMRIERALPAQQRIGFIAWQLGIAALVVESVFPGASLGWLSAFGGAGLVALMLVVRPWRRPSPGLPGGPAVRLAMVSAWAFTGVTVLLLLVKPLALLGVPLPPRFDDATRHAFTLGAMQLAIFGFAGRMVPSFEAVQMPSPGLYDAGVATVILATVLRVVGLAPLGVATRVLVGLSGPLALFGVGLVGFCFARTLLAGARARKDRDARAALVTIRVGASA